MLPHGAFDRLPGDHQGLRRRRRPRHARRPQRRDARERDQRREDRGARGLRQRHGLHGEIPREAAPHRVPGAGRQLRQRRLPRRARLLAAAPAPEDHRGIAGPGHHREAARRHDRAPGRRLHRGRLPQRRHPRIPVRGRQLLLHRDEHARAGRAPGHRARHGHRHRQDAAADRGRRAPAVQAGGHRAARLGDGMPHQRRGPEDLRALARAGPAVARAGRAWRARRQPPVLGLQRAAVLRLADREADLLRREPRHGDRAHA